MPTDDPSDPCPRIEPEPKRPQRVVVGWARQPREAEGCSQELAGLFERRYSIPWSAWRMSVWGTVKPSALAVFKLITSSNFAGRSTGRSVGLAPLRILSTYSAARR